FAFSVSGINTGDGKVAFVMALLGVAGYGLAPFRRTFAWTQGVLGALVALIGIVDTVDIERSLSGTEGFGGGAGAGVYLTAAAATAWTVLAIVSGVHRRPSRPDR
ncbi:MAG TPA: hypothetical protein VFD37_04505, partial [Solirubrobacterales bacterium]|nr:hypothetical protein [Solirubrobacterales bacterium]